MRNVIIGLSIFLLVLSGIVTYKTLKIPSDYIHYPDNLQVLESKEVPPKTEAISGQLDREQAANQALIEKSQAADVGLEDKPSDEKENTPANVEAKEPLRKTGVLAVFGDNMFRPGQFVIDDNLEDAVQKLVPDIMASSEQHVIIEGHTDNIKPIAGKMDNTKLSFLRAKGISMILIKNGIPPDRISVIGYGDIHPVASNETIEGRAKNRRVEIKLVPADKEF